VDGLHRVGARGWPLGSDDSVSCSGVQVVALLTGRSAGLGSESR